MPRAAFPCLLPVRRPSAENTTDDTLEEEESNYASLALAFAQPRPDRLCLAFHDRGAKFLENDLIVGVDFQMMISRAK